MESLGTNVIKGTYTHWGLWDDYQSAPRWRRWPFGQLDLHPEGVIVDLFGNPQNADLQMFVTRQMDAFAFEWP